MLDGKLEGEEEDGGLEELLELDGGPREELEEEELAGEPKEQVKEVAFVEGGLLLIFLITGCAQLKGKLP